MNVRDGLIPTSPTTDYDSGGSAGVDYVYEEQPPTRRRHTKGRGLGKETFSRVKTGMPNCVCGAVRNDDASKSDTDDQGRQGRPLRHQPSKTADVTTHRGKDHHKGSRKHLIEKRRRGAKAPYIEEYPDDTPRPAILLKEHKILRRFSASDAKHAQDFRDRSPPPVRRSVPLTERRPPTRSPRPCPRQLSKHSGQRRRRPESKERHQGSVSDSDVESASSSFEELARASASNRQTPQPTPTAARGAARVVPQPGYSSSWPLKNGSRHPHQRSERYDSDHDSSEEFHDDERLLSRSPQFDGHHHPRKITLSFQSEQAQHSDRHTRRRDSPVIQPEDKIEDRRPPPPTQQPRPRVTASHSNMSTTDQGRRSVATSLCEVWRGQPGEWESPYGSASQEDLSEDDVPVRLLQMDSASQRQGRPSPPRLLPSHARGR